MPPGSSLVEIDLIEKAGGTLVRFTHSGLPDEEECASHEKGWTHYLQQAGRSRDRRRSRTGYASLSEV